MYIDQNLSMKNHVANLCRVCYLELRRISLMRPFLSQAAAVQLVSSSILSRLDYCNSVLAGLPSALVDRLQKVQNNAAKLVMKKSKRDHVTPLLKELHWLPVTFRPQYKIAVLAYRFFDGTLPPYLSATLSQYIPARSLRSSNQKLLTVPKRRLKSFGHRSFSYLAPTIWNALPDDLRFAPSISSFRKALKTHLFNLAFSQ